MIWYASNLEVLPAPLQTPMPYQRPKLSPVRNRLDRC